MHQETTHILFGLGCLRNHRVCPDRYLRHIHSPILSQSSPSRWALEQFLDYQKGLVSRPPGVMVNLEISLSNWVYAPTDHNYRHAPTHRNKTRLPNLIAQKGTRRTSSPIRGMCIALVAVGCSGLPGFLGERSKIW